ncbi:helix-turn-helix domain-containing protein [Novosphingobium soli]|uniref:Helix-turn-helix domain-containing protein n=1 Tax=Novosphingobium soli TaxID=574956 RepID=A0ABV6CXH7_9SPHN
MTTTAPERTYNATVDWFGVSGMPDRMPAEAQAYARRLTRYISDASTVRARTLEEFGQAPPVEKIRGWRAERVAEIEGRRAARKPDEFVNMEGRAANEDELEIDLDALGAAIAARLAKLEIVDTVPAVPLRPSAAPLSPDLQQTLARPIRGQPRTHREVVSHCARRFGLKAEDLLGSSRKRPVVRARQFTATLLRARGNSYPAAGRYLGNMDHSTVIHSVRTLFLVGMQDPDTVEAWMELAPCATKFARSPEELDLMLGLTP